MADEILCLSCSGRLAWFPEVSAWRHLSAPPGTVPHVAQVPRGDAGFVQEVVESDVDTGRRIQAERDEVIARARAIREALGEISLDVERPRVEPRGESAFEMRTGVDLDGKPFVYPWLLEPTWTNTDGSVVRVTPGTGAKSAAKKTDRLIEHPAPVEPARTAFDSDLPAAAKTLRGLLVEHGWEIEQLYARGYKPDVHQRAAKTVLVDVAVLRAIRPANREALVACWVDSGYDLGYHIRPNNTEMLGANALKSAAKAPVLLCSTCKEPPHTHPQPDDSPACFQGGNS